MQLFSSIILITLNNLIKCRMLAVGFIWFTTQICAFWEAGHLIIAKIAYDELKQKDPEFLGHIEAEIMDIRRFISTSDAGHPFIESSVWADKINGVTHRKSEQMHYIDTPYIYLWIWLKNVAAEQQYSWSN